jgi:ribosomal protein S18 acetylase RimI-like enzyme
MNDDTLVLSTTDAPADDRLAVIDAGLEEFNLSVAPLSDVRPLASFATDPAGRVVGGASGRTWGRCCELLQLWVEPRRRSAGVGSRLLRLFEAHAQRRGCDVYYLTTLSYQAPAFYRKHGYAVLAEIAGYPNGIIKYLMHKSGASVVTAPSHPQLW